MKTKMVFILVLGLTFFLHSTVTAQRNHSFKLFYPGIEEIVNYQKYGEFKKIGTSQYKYIIKDPGGLSRAVGCGIYPNNRVFQDPEYKALLESGKLDGSPWDLVLNPPYKNNFYKWASLPEEDGIKLFFTAKALQEAGLFKHAIKAYYAVVIHYPKDACWSKDGSFVWYVAPAAISEIKNILRQHPELGIDLEGARITVENGQDTNLYNDVITVDPGRFIKVDPERLSRDKYDLSLLEVIQTRGRGKVKLVQYNNRHWQMIIATKPFCIKGITYIPTPVGCSPAEESLNMWMSSDSDENGIIDAPYETWIDKNRNDKKDLNEKAIGDFQLLREMGCNTIRIFYDDKIDKKILRDMHENYGINVAMCNLVGAYTVGSGASWENGTDYTDPVQKQRMKKNVEEMVREHKDEPYMLLWILGNENNLPVGYKGINASRTNASKYPAEYAKFLNEIAVMIHKLDPDHPVAVGNADVGMINIYAKHAPEIDILGISAYRGKDGFGYLWSEVRDMFDRPIFLVEYGCDAYWEGRGEDERAQVLYHKNCWEDIAYNKAGGWGEGNSIGGCIFEWLDEWWKDNISGDSSYNHQTLSQADMNFPDGRTHEEWFGICSQGNGKNTPFLRQPRKTYYLYKKLWN